MTIHENTVDENMTTSIGGGSKFKVWGEYVP